LLTHNIIAGVRALPAATLSALTHCSYIWLFVAVLQLGIVVLYALGHLDYTEEDNKKRQSLVAALDSPRRKASGGSPRSFDQSSPVSSKHSYLLNSLKLPAFRNFYSSVCEKAASVERRQREPASCPPRLRP
jgi:hypothetical protein